MEPVHPAIALPGGPELLIVLLVLLVVPLALAYWVYRDATNRGESRALAWSAVIFGLSLFWLVPGLLGVAIYLGTRD